MLSEQEKNDLRKLLEEKKSHLEDQLEALLKARDFGEDVDSFDEETDESEAFANTASIEETLRHHLHHIEDSLESLDADNYGECKQCGHKISINLLKIIPESRLCQDCKVKLRRAK